MTTENQSASAAGTVFLICTNERGDGSTLPCCAARGGHEVLEAFRAEFARRRYPRGIKVVGTTCLTTCQLGPTVAVFPEGIWYVGVTPDDAAAVFDAHLTASGPVTRLLPSPDVRVW